MRALEFKDYEKFYLSLKALSVVRSAYDFSVNFLGGNQSSYSVMKVKKTQLSYAAHLTLIHKLIGIHGEGENASMVDTAVNDILEQLQRDLNRRVTERLNR